MTDKDKIRIMNKALELIKSDGHKWMFPAAMIAEEALDEIKKATI